MQCTSTVLYEVVSRMEFCPSIRFVAFQCDEEADRDRVSRHVRRGPDGHRRRTSDVARVRVQVQTGRPEAPALSRRAISLPSRLAHVVRCLPGVFCLTHTTVSYTGLLNLLIIYVIARSTIGPFGMKNLHYSKFSLYNLGLMNMYTVQYIRIQL